MRKAVINLQHWSASGLIGGAAAVPEAQLNHLCGPNTMPHDHSLSSGTALNAFVKLRTSATVPLASAHRCKQGHRNTSGTIPSQLAACLPVISVFLTFIALYAE